MKEATDRPVRRTVADAVWLVAAVGIPVSFLWNLYHTVEREWRGGMTGSGIALGMLVYGVYAIGVAWIALGAWRRTSWHRRRINGPIG